MSFTSIIIAAVVGFVVLNLVLAQVASRRAKALEGKPLPDLPGDLGRRIAGSPRALVYFFTPSCAACRPITPRMKELAKAGSPVFPIDASHELDLARALSVMATPTTLEVRDGQVVNAFIGAALPASLWERFTAR